jgi:hypothetical protein
MRQRDVPWCCNWFRTSCRREFEKQETDGLFRDRRGFFVGCRRETEGPLFVLACRSVAAENVARLPEINVPISLESEFAIRFCPSCGAELARHYAHDIDQLCA